jgi:hypothetical protein
VDNAAIAFDVRELGLTSAFAADELPRIHGSPRPEIHAEIFARKLRSFLK